MDEIFAAVFKNLTHSRVKFPASLQSALVILLFKNSSISDPASYRPISLQTIIAKFLKKSCDLRFKALIPKLITTVEIGFGPGRCITESLNMLQYALHWAKTKCPRAVIFAPDFAKAYHRVQWSYLHKVLTRLGIGHRWCRFIRVLYSDRMAHLILMVT